jgi:molybdenum cofactor cytidylyltransferase
MISSTLSTPSEKHSSMLNKPSLSRQLGLIIIAAGNSSRLGHAKQLVEFKTCSLLQKSLNLTKQLALPTTCVLGYNAARLKDSLTPSEQFDSDDGCLLDFIVNSKWQTGMGTSIATGVESMSDTSKDISAVMILLCDQYLLTEKDLQKLINAWQENPDQIIASQYTEPSKQHLVNGAPAIFPKKYFKNLLQLTTKGARGLLEKEKNSVISVASPNAAFDLDTAEDLKALRQFEKIA